MSEKVTPREVYEAHCTIVYRKKQEGKLPEGWPMPPATWEEVNEPSKEVYALMALKINCISGEFKIEGHS